MTSTVLTPAAASSSQATNAAKPPPRKRRRRTAAGGATDDCFTCRKRAVKCDRKRPYCTQCIEIGKECSGYKTTLTWGVGVASRGKLRGLTCPIANKNVDGSDITPGEDRSKRRKSSTSTANTANSDGNGDGRVSGTAIPSSEPIAFFNTTPAAIAPPTMTFPGKQTSTNWQIRGFHDDLEARRGEHGRHNSFILPPLHRLQTALGPPYRNPSMPASGMSTTSYADTEYHSPLEYPQTPGSAVFSEAPTSHPMTAYSMDAFCTVAPAMDPYLDSVSLAPPEAPIPGTMDPNHAQLSPVDEVLYNSNDLALSTLEPFPGLGDDLGDEEDQNALALFDSRFSSPFFHLTPRLQSLLDYYDRCICPYLVAFDNEQNPYRQHILRLAINNEGLQNAIAALATNNMRMRKKQVQPIGFVEELVDSLDNSDSRHANHASAEEAMYKQMSIDQLNMQLTDTRAAHDDSVLATLLILCLFHVCDSGFSKFKTQLAGVQKLLSLRKPGIRSDFTGWVEMFFCWLDVMTSTVNDREMQIKGESLDMLDFSANLGALEQFSGCDGRLFKLIARLGRLNLLAQGRPVKNSRGISSGLRNSNMKRKFAHFGPGRPARRPFANMSLSPLDYENLDGNGWGTPIISSDEDAEGSADDQAVPKPLDDRREFWTEWHDLRNRLQAWQMDAAAIPAANDPSRLDTSHVDLVHINECFRFAALLYTERLGNPVLPSAHPQFQSLVSQALSHITALSITSCVNKFLLWPVFIVGTECVEEPHRNIIRSRCVEITKESGFFNNISGLEVLERVWSEIGENTAGHLDQEVKARRRDSEAERADARYGQAFRWRKAMDRVDGEYIMI